MFKSSFPEIGSTFTKITKVKPLQNKCQLHNYTSLPWMLCILFHSTVYGADRHCGQVTGTRGTPGTGIPGTHHAGRAGTNRVGALKRPRAHHKSATDTESAAGKKGRPLAGLREGPGEAAIGREDSQWEGFTSGKPGCKYLSYINFKGQNCYHTIN